MGKKSARPKGRPAEPAAAANHLHRAVELHRRGDLPEALKSYRLFLAAHPDHAEVLHTAAGLHFQLGDQTKAIELLKRAVEHVPTSVDYLNDLGGMHMAGGTLDEAERCFRRALELLPDQPLIRNNLGQALFRLDKLDDAITCFREVVRQQPEYADAHYNLGVALDRSGQTELAIAAYEAAARIAPGLAVARFNLGHALLRLGRNEAAVNSFRAALNANPGYVEAMLGLGQALKEAWRADEAVSILRGFLHHRPKSAVGHIHLGNALEITGDLDGAQAEFRQALALAPGAAGAWHGLASSKKFRNTDDADIAAMESALAASDTDEARCTLHFALGKAGDDARDFDRAFNHYAAGNSLKRRSLTNPHPLAAQRVDQIIEVFNRSFLAAQGDLGDPSTLPIFIVGMPRSGTTLTEQIIASHPAVHGGGELSYFGSVTSGLHVLLKSTRRYPYCCEALTRQDAAMIAGPYLQLLRWHSPNAGHVTDKMPGNFHHLGLIALLFPKAAIIHCVRDPVDTCLSIYFQHFARGHEYSYDLTDTGTTYVQYQRLMRHWAEVLPGRIHTSDYDQLIADPEQNARKLIAACGLEWDDRCLAFHQNRREVRTASIAQVRQPIYKSSGQRWRNYERHLQPLLAALEVPGGVPPTP